MKVKICILVLLLMCNVVTYAQIDIMLPATSEQIILTPQKEKAVYDSLSNAKLIGKTEYEHLIGQKVLFIPYDNDKRDIRIKKDYNVKKEISKKEAKYREKNHLSFFVENKRYYIESYEEESVSIPTINGKYFTIIGYSNSYSSFDWDGGGYKFELKMEGDTTNTVYKCRFNHYNSSEVINSTFIVVGYFEKMREKYENKDFVLLMNDNYHSDKINLINTKTHRRPTEIDNYSIWHCSKISVFPNINNTYTTSRASRIVLIMENEKYGQHYTNLDNIVKSYSSNQTTISTYATTNGSFLLKEYYDELLVKKQELEERQKKEVAEVAKRKRAEAAKKQAEKEKKQAEEEKKREERKQELINKYGEKLGTDISYGIVRIGMTKEQCREAWGDPMDINTTTTLYGTHEQWVYYGYKYLYFDGDILTTIQK